MKTGRTIQELAVELERRERSKRDFVAPTNTLTLHQRENFHALDATTAERLDRAGEEFALAIGGEKATEAFAITEHAHDQIAHRLEIPKKYYDHLRKEHRRLLAANVNELFRAHPERRMVRTLDGKARAFLSDRYRRIDDAQVARAILPAIRDLGPQAQIASAEVTERKLYLKVVLNEIRDWVQYTKPGTHERIRQEVRSGFFVQNSEVGSGAYSIRPFAEVLVCTNALIVVEYTQRATHLGRRVELGDGDEEERGREIFSDETLQADDRTLLLKTRDTVRAMAGPEQFRKTVERMAAAGEQGLTGDPSKAVEELAAEHQLTDGERGDVLRHLITGGDLSQWGLINAVTRTAQDAADYDRATELETLGGKMLAAVQ